MSYKECSIVFDKNEHGIFFTGQIITGKVILNFHKSKKLKGVKLQISGFALCQWREKHGKKRPDITAKRNKPKTFYGHEDYIATTTYLFGSEDSKNFTIDAGNYTYQFACPIPINCPSSFEGLFGHIRYLVKVVFMRCGASDRTHNVGFTVLRLLDLNNESPILREPVSNEALENFCLFHTKGVHLRVSLQQNGFVPGQMIAVSAVVNNESKIDCKKLIILLNLRATYMSEVPCMRTACDKINLVKKLCGPVPRQSQRNFAETIRVPPTPPSLEMLSKIVRLTYEICVIASMNHLMRNPKAVLPITIGNVPLTFGTLMAPQSSVQDDLPTTSRNCRALLTPLHENNDEEDEEEEDNVSADADADADADGEEDEQRGLDIPPPTYEEAMYMTTNIADNDVNTVSAETHFTPRYPVYDVDSLAATNSCNTNVQSPPPNLPKKRRKRKKKRSRQQPSSSVNDEEQSKESSVQI